MSKILLIEDDPVLGRSLSIKLELEGYKLQWAQTLQRAREILAAEEFKLILADVGLPDGSGIDFLRELRSQNYQPPVIILTARSDEDTAVESLNVGASDFIRKPFGSRELMVRIKKTLNEFYKPDAQLRLGDLVVLIEQRKLMYKDSEIELNRREFEIFKYLAQNVDRVISREMLITAMGSDSDIIDRTVDSHVSHIRTKFKQKNVESVRIAPVYGVGYRLEKC